MARTVAELRMRTSPSTPPWSIIWQKRAKLAGVLGTVSSPANDNARRPEFEKRVRLELADVIRDQRHHQRLQIPIADVPG
jgi:hypothetical protein